MNARERELLIEACAGAYRPVDTNGHLQPPAEWWDLSPEALDEVFRRQLQAREVERWIDRDGESATVKAVRARILVG